VGIGAPDVNSFSKVTISPDADFKGFSTMDDITSSETGSFSNPDGVIMTDDLDPDIEQLNSGIDQDPMAGSTDEDVRVEQMAVIDIDFVVRPLETDDRICQPGVFHLKTVSFSPVDGTMKQAGIVPNQVDRVDQECGYCFDNVLQLAHEPGVYGAD
jgi:hypothetical protein